jgi:hypothetical protein
VDDGECTPTYEPAGGRRRLDDCIATAVAASECPPNAQYMANCDDLCGNQIYGAFAASIAASSSTPSTRRLLDSDATPAR